jgi:hypothetical protein
MALATDGQGNFLTLDPDGKWVPAQRAKNDAGDEVIYDGEAWKPVPGQPATAPSQQPTPSIGTVAGLRQAMAPEPGWVSSSVLPIATKEVSPGQGAASAGIKLDWGPVRSVVNPLLDLMEGTGQATSVGGPNAPLAGKVSPEATAFLATNALMRGGDLRFGPPISATAEPAIQRAAPLSPEFRNAPFTEAARTKFGVPEQPALPAPAAIPTTSAAAKDIASAYYKQADQAGGTLTPQFTNKFVDSVAKAMPQTEAGKAIAGDNAVTKLVGRLEAIKDQPLTLQAAQEVDEALGGLITKEYGIKGISKEGARLAEIQRGFRDQIQNAEAGDVTGGTAGFEALGPARKAWSQAMKLADLERIQQRAEMTDNPATSVRTQIKTLLTNDAKSRGYSADERAALEAAAERGAIGGALHVFGSRLVPLAVGAAGFSGGVLPGLAAAGVAHGASTLMRNAATGLAERRLNNAMTVLGRGVPPMPRNVLGPPP